MPLFTTFPRSNSLGVAQAPRKVDFGPTRYAI